MGAALAAAPLRRRTRLARAARGHRPRRAARAAPRPRARGRARSRAHRGRAAAARGPARGGRAVTAVVFGLAIAGRALAALWPRLLAAADAYRQDGRTTEAVATYRAVLALDANSVPALNGLALILAQAGQPDGALIAVDRVLALRPKDPDGLFLKGLLLYQREDWKGAVD